VVALTGDVRLGLVGRLGFVVQQQLYDANKTGWLGVDAHRDGIGSSPRWRALVDVSDIRAASGLCRDDGARKPERRRRTGGVVTDAQLTPTRQAADRGSGVGLFVRSVKDRGQPALTAIGRDSAVASLCQQWVVDGNKLTIGR